MSKVRVYKLAKELGLTNTELIGRLAALNIDATNHMSTLSDEEVERIRSELAGKEEVSVKETRITPGVIRRRRRVEVKEAVPEEHEAPLEAPESAAVEPEAREEPPLPAEAPEHVEAVTVGPEAVTPATVVPEPERLGVVGRKPAPDLEGELARAEKKKKAEVLPREPVLEDEEVEKGKRRKTTTAKKVIEFKVRQREALDWEPEEGKEPAAPARRTVVEPGRERRPPKRAPLKPVITIPKLIKRKVRMGESITIGDLARRLSVKASEIIKKLMQSGVMASINQAIDRDTATLIASEYGYEVESIQQEESLFLPAEVDQPEQQLERPPVVTIMGHVNHGKTRLLDAIRKTNVMESEAGGITQHIGAYTVRTDDHTVVFLDTPGHEAFTKMRARGAKVTDIVVLVVAADDGVMPQTVEAINHAKAARVPIIVAVNKMDLPDANMEKVKKGLAEHGLLPEEWGGETLYAGISAKEGTGIQELLEMILLQAEMLEQKANPDKKATGVVIEARLDRTLGPVATVLLQTGTLRVGDPFVTGVCYGRVRALLDDHGERVDEAGPSLPVEVLGWSGVPEAGDLFVVVEDERKAKLLSSIRLDKARKVGVVSQAKMSLEDLYERIRREGIKELNIILKADVQGSMEVLSESLQQLSNEEVVLKILHGGVGGITETDVMLASASDAIIIGFNVRATVKALTLAEQEKVDIRFYSVIYDAVADLKAAMTGLMKPVFKEVLLGHAEVRETFSISRLGTIAGSHVLDGRIDRSSKVRVLRDNLVIYEGKLASLRRFKDDVKEVQAGYECGIRVENFNDLKTGDILEAFALEQVAPHAQPAGQERRPT